MTKAADHATIERILDLIRDSGVGPRHGASLLARAVVRVLREVSQSSTEPISTDELEELMRGA